MTPTLLALLRCPECRHRVSARGDATLACGGCGREFIVRDGIPRFVVSATPTATTFGYLWAEGSDADAVRAHVPYHLDAMRDALHAPPMTGLVIDGGCGDGIDLANSALAPDCEVVGVELSDGGIGTSAARSRGLPRAHIVQGDLLKLPLADDAFDGGYSYGVVHHTPDPARAVRELARVLKPGAPLLLYVYEDFSDRSWTWRAALRFVNAFRGVTTRMPPAILMGLCRILSPVVWLLCTLPSRHFAWARRFPYRHGTHPWSMAGDIYDRFGAPIEQRYSERGARQLAEDAGLVVRRTAQRRGWMVWADKPVTRRASTGI